MRQISVCKILLIVFILLCIYPAVLFAQVENIPADHPIYLFLKKMQVQGIINDYNDVIIPLSRKNVAELLSEVEKNKSKLTDVDLGFLQRMEEKIFIDHNLSNHAVNLFDGFPSEFISNLITDKQKHLYSYKDSLVSFFIEPSLEYKYIYNSFNKNNSSLLDFGGIAKGSYGNWFGFYVKATNGIQAGNRATARLDQRVEQSFTFNNTGLNTFDNTEGYLRFQNGIVNLQLGREKILWGTGYLNKLQLGENPPLFDFVKFNIAYKSLSYSFLHGWLVHPRIDYHVDSLGLDIRTKPSKYVAISRLNYNPVSSLNFGISQSIIYSNRPFELAYLNPFLFWESAQRSMNDLDNSFLTFDGRFLLTDGLEINSSIMFDDINFKRLFKGEWAGSNNGTAWQIGSFFTKPILPDNFILRIEYIQIRPYIFSHPGGYADLTYTSNGYLLGTNLQPNSTLFSLKLDYQFTSKISAGIKYVHQLHGKNVYDENGNLIQNVGGDVFQNYRYDDPSFSYLLDGIREVNDELTFNFEYEMTYGIYFDFVYQHQRYSSKSVIKNGNNFWASLKLNFE